MTSPKFRPVECNRGCGQQVYFDRQSENGWSSSGKMVPLQWDEDKGPTDTGHQCPNSDYNRSRKGGGGSGSQQTTTGAREEKVPSGMEMVLGNTLDILGKVEMIVQRVEAMGKQLYSLQKDIDAIKASPLVIAKSEQQGEEPTTTE